jgi:hypothetical protein
MPASPGGTTGAPGGPAGGPGGPGGRAGGSATEITGTKDPGLFMSEHWGMTAFSTKIPNGKYVAKLYFAETYEGITGPSQRVFSYNVQGHEFKDFDVWAKTGGRNRAYIKTVPVEVANGGNGGGYPVCFDFKTGEVRRNERDADKRRLRKGSITVADGRLY